MRLLVLGFDGLGFQFWRDYLHSYLPGFDFVRLDSPVPASGPGWTSLYTGQPLSQHGVSDVWGRDIGGSKTYADTWAQTIWFQLAKRGMVCELCNLPATWPAKPIDRYHIPGMKTHNPWAYPSALSAMVGSSEFLQWADICNWGGDTKPGNWHQVPAAMGYEACMAKAQEYAVCLTRQFVKWHAHDAVDFAWLVYTFVDRLWHIWWREPGLPGRAATMVHEVITKLSLILNPTCWLIVSDHGVDNERGHHRDGILAASGMKIPDIGRDWAVTDVYFLIARIFGLDTVALPPPVTGEEWPLIEQRLKDLGYLD